MNVKKPKYLRIHDELKILIRNQQYAPGDLLPTEAQLCKKYGTSRPTIAKALNLLARDELIERKAGFGTRVLAPGRAAISVGLLIPRLHETEIFEPICASITEAAAGLNMQIIRPSELSLPQTRAQMAEPLTEQFINAGVHGVFFTPIEHIPDSESFNLNILQRLTQAGIRVVLLDRDVFAWPQRTPFDLVGIDNIEAGYITAGHLINNGCKKLAFVSEENPAMTVQQRRIGSREALIQSGETAKDLLDIEFLSQNPAKTARDLLESKADGVICSNDATAAPLLRALLDQKVDIPGTLQVCGFDDVKYASLLSVPLTSYRQPCSDIGKVAAKVMLNRIQSPDSPARRITLKGELIIRHSSPLSSVSH